MSEAAGGIGLFGLLAVAGLAWGFARVLDAPRWTGQAILLALLLVAAASQLLLPPEAPLRQSVGGAARAGAWLVVIAVPVLGYRWVLRRLRARHDAGAPPPAGHPRGFVLIDDDATLMSDIRARAGAAGAVAESFSIAHRGADGEIEAAAQARLADGIAMLGPVWVAPERRRQGLGTGLIEALEAEARRRGAARVVADTVAPGLAALLSARGYAPAGRVALPGGGERVTLVKEMP